LLVDEMGHATACHFWREIAPASEAIAGEAEMTPALARLIQAFEDHSSVAGSEPRVAIHQK
jgi:hypothetical protein